VAHFHAGESTTENARHRTYDFEQIRTHLDCVEKWSGWCLFGDLNFRKNKQQRDTEFQTLQNRYSLLETPSTIDNTYKLIPKSRSKFSDKRIPSRTDRIVHNKPENDYQLLSRYSVVFKQGSDHEAAGAGSEPVAVSLNYGGGGTTQNLEREA
jgi:hypothetical protein